MDDVIDTSAASDALHGMVDGAIDWTVLAVQGIVNLVVAGLIIWLVWSIWKNIKDYIKEIS